MSRDINEIESLLKTLVKAWEEHPENHIVRIAVGDIDTMLNELERLRQSVYLNYAAKKKAEERQRALQVSEARANKAMEAILGVLIQCEQLLDTLSVPSLVAHSEVPDNVLARIGHLGLAKERLREAAQKVVDECGGIYVLDGMSELAEVLDSLWKKREK